MKIAAILCMAGLVGVANAAPGREAGRQPSHRSDVQGVGQKAAGLSAGAANA